VNTGYTKREVEKVKRPPEAPYPKPPATVTITVRQGHMTDTLWYAHMEGTPTNMTAAGKTISEAVDRMFEIIILRGVQASVADQVKVQARK
jgi:hypothetical protein